MIHHHHHHPDTPDVNIDHQTISHQLFVTEPKYETYSYQEGTCVVTLADYADFVYVCSLCLVYNLICYFSLFGHITCKCVHDLFIVGHVASAALPSAGETLCVCVLLLLWCKHQEVVRSVFVI